jgi:hypothetical protein
MRRYRLSNAEYKLIDQEGNVAAAEALAAGASEQWAAQARELAVEAAKARIKDAKFANCRPSSGGAPDADDDDGNPPPREVDTTSSYMADLEAASSLITSHPVFHDIMNRSPLPITDDFSKSSGVQSVFDPVQCKIALGRERKYICSANFWWQNLVWSPTPNVPLQTSRVLELGKHLFHIANGDRTEDVPLPHLPGQITIALTSADVDVFSMKGSLKRVSPDEIVHGAVLVCADEIRRKVPDCRLHRWRDIFLSCCFVFELIDIGMDGLYWRSYNLRQTLAATYTGCKRSAKQMAHEIFMYKKFKEAEAGGTPLKFRQLAACYQTKGRTAGESDAVTENYIRNALTVYEKICIQPALSRCIDQMELRFGLSSCLSNMTSLNTIVTRTDDYESRKWTLESIIDSVLAGFLANEEVTKAQLQGSGSIVSLCTLFQLRRRVLSRYLSVELPKIGVCSEDLEVFRPLLADHQSYRNSVRGLNPTADEALDKTWKDRCKPSSILALDLLEDRRTCDPIML